MIFLLCYKTMLIKLYGGGKYRLIMIANEDSTQLTLLVNNKSTIVALKK